MLTRTYAFLEPYIAASRPGRLVLVRRFLLALERALKNPAERQGACIVAGSVLGMPTAVLARAADGGEQAFDQFLERVLSDRIAAAPEGLHERADWLVRWGPLVEALVPEGPHGASPVPEMVTLAPDLAALFARLPELSRSPLPLLLEGEPGTGREALARAVHAMFRAPRPFVTVDAGQLEPSEAQRLLFGHPLAPGLVQTAGEGTLFIRNAELLPPVVQHRLARTLELGLLVDEDGRGRTPTMFRLLTAVGDGALEGVGHGPGQLRPDFAYRAATLHARLPPLARRGEDLAALYRNIVRRFVLRREQPLSPEEVAREQRMQVTPRALLALYAYKWPGNVAEFVSVVREARQRAGSGALELAHLPERVVAALGRPGETAEDRLRATLVEVAPATVAGPEEVAQARKRLRAWLDDELSRVIDRETNEAIVRSISTYNALRDGFTDELPVDGALYQLRAAVARELLLPTGSILPLFWDERVELVGEMEAIAAAQATRGAVARRLFDLGRALVLYPAQAQSQLVAQRVGIEERPSAIALALVQAAREY
jgi:DNA-binding NtrC family response regulator